MATSGAAASFWGKEELERLVYLYQNQPDLWDIQRPNYSKKDYRTHALERIQAAFDNTCSVPIIPDLLVESDTKSETFGSLLKDHNLHSLFYNDSDLSNFFNTTTFGVDIHNTSSPLAGNGTDQRESLFERVLRIPVRAISENSRVGWLLASKALVQMVANPIMGVLSNRIGCRKLLFFGTWVLLVSSIMFSVSGTYTPLLLARASQGISSAATMICGMSMIAERYEDDGKRSRAMGTAMGGMACGILVGYPFGGLLYAVAGRSVPFVGIALLCLINIGIQYSYRDGLSSNTDMKTKPASIHRLLMDPYIIICAGALMLTSMSLAVLESTVPLWVMDSMDVQQWQIGLIFIPDSLGYLLGTNVFPVIAKTYGRWLFTLTSMAFIAAGLISIPFCQLVYQLLVPHLCLGLGVGVTDAAIMPLLALLVDKRHVAPYGSVYAIVQLAICLAYGLGPAVAGQIVKLVGFKWSMWGMALAISVFAPLCLFLRSIPVSEDLKAIMSDDDELVGAADEELQIYTYADTYHALDAISE